MLVSVYLYNADVKGLFGNGSDGRSPQVTAPLRLEHVTAIRVHHPERLRLLHRFRGHRRRRCNQRHWLLIMPSITANYNSFYHHRH